MKVETKRVLSGKLRELLTAYQESGANVDITSIEGTLRNDATGIFHVPAVDDLGGLVFLNRELLCRFTSLPLPRQLTFIGCIRKAMNDNQVLEVHIEADWSSANKLTVKVQQITTGPLVLYGKGPLRFF